MRNLPDQNGMIKVELNLFINEDMKYSFMLYGYGYMREAHQSRSIGKLKTNA